MIIEKMNNGFRDLYLYDFIQWMILIFWGIYQVTVSIEKSEAAYYFYITVLIPYLLFLIFTNIKFELKHLDLFFDILFVSGIILSIYSLYVLFNINFDLKFRIPSIWTHYNLVAAYFMALLLFNLSFLVNSKNKSKFFFHISSLIFILLGLIMTQTRGIWLATIIAVAFYFFKKPKLIIPVLVMIGLLVVFFNEIINERLMSVIHFGNDVSSLGRLQAWLSSIELIKENFWFGYGFDAYRHLRDNVFSSYFVILPHPHNTYLTLTLELGFIGFIFYFGFFVKAFYFTFRVRKKSSDPELLKFFDGLQLTFVGLLVAFMFEPYFTILGSITYVIWILISLSYFLRYNFLNE
jgi:O-antigen ligase